LRLAFIDPGLRKASFFLELRKSLAPGIECLYWSQRPIVRSWMRSAGVAMHPADEAPPPRAYEISEAELRRAVGPKELALRPEKALRKARRLLALLAAFIDEQQVDAILVWNGSNLRGQLAIHLAKQRRLPVVYAEHGYLPGTTQVDLEGVNDDSSVTRLARMGLAQLPPDPQLDAVLDAQIAHYKAGRPMRDANQRPPAELRRNLAVHWASRAAFWIERRLLPRINRLAVPVAGGPLPARYVLLPFQVRKDSQLVLHSPLYGNNMETIVRELDAALERIDPQLRLVAKFHPYELPQVQRRYRELPHRYPRVFFTSDGPMTRLLEKAEAVVTVNSTAGFEALLYDKPVLALGRNFYTVPGIVECLSRRGELEASLRTTLACTPDRERRRAFLRYVYTRLLARGSYNDFSEGSLRRFAAHLSGLLAGTPVRAVVTPRAITHEPVMDLGLPAWLRAERTRTAR
jgi:capsular polysaccharide export protein